MSFQKALTSQNSEVLPRAVEGALEHARDALNVKTELRLLVGVSGGEDSTALLHAVCSLSERCNLSVIVCHVNHRLRPESDKEAKFVERLCAFYGIPCFVFHAGEKPPQENLEAWARRKRYEFFEHCRVREQAHLILTAHHKNDQAETVIFRLCTGRLATDAHAIALFDPLRKILRPLLEVSKTMVEDYAMDHRLAFVSDSSNQDTRRTRNLIRHQVLPILETGVNPTSVDAISIVAKRLSQDEDSLWNEAERAHRVLPYPTQLGDIFTLSEAVRWRILVFRAAEVVGESAYAIGYSAWQRALEVFERVFTGTIDRKKRTIELGRFVVCEFDAHLGITFRDLSHPDAKIEKIVKSSSKKTELPGGVVAQQKKNTWLIDEQTEISLSFERCSLLERNQEETQLGSDGLADRAVAYFDASIISPSIIYVRTRAEGDVMEVLDRGRRKVKKIFNERQIPAPLRDAVALVCAGDEILWIPGICKSEIAKPTDLSSNLLCIRFERRASKDAGAIKEPYEDGENYCSIS